MKTSRLFKLCKAKAEKFRRQSAESPISRPAEGYFQYINVPAPKEYEFGFNRGENSSIICFCITISSTGNPEHFASRYEQSKDHRFRTRVRQDLEQ